MTKNKPKLKSINERFKKGMALGWLRVGKYTFCEFLDYKEKATLWVEKDSGEAMVLDKKSLDKIWKEYF